MALVRERRNKPTSWTAKGINSEFVASSNVQAHAEEFSRRVPTSATSVLSSSMTVQGFTSHIVLFRCHQPQPLNFNEIFMHERHPSG
jgi:hypothetical protein